MKSMSLIFIILFFTSLLSCKKRDSDSQIQEEFDQVNAPSLFGVKETLHLKDIKQKSATFGALPKRPWADTYWPLNEAGMAVRWIDSSKATALHKKFPPFDDDKYLEKAEKIIKTAVDEAKAMEGSWQSSLYLSPAEKYDIARGDSSYGLTRREWASYAENYKYYEENEIPWGWMGHCHGWAPASFLFEPPKYGVRFKSPTGNQVFFTPGDIRGLLTKAAADNQMNKQVSFLGSRCSLTDKKLQRDKRGRIVDGYLGYTQDGQFSHSKPIKIIHNNWQGHSELGSTGLDIIFQFGPSYPFSKKYWMQATHYVDQKEGVIGVNIFTTKKVNGELRKDRLVASANQPDLIGCQMQADNICRPKSDSISFVEEREKAILFDVLKHKITKTTQAARVLQNYTHFKYQKDCRDLNAGAFHVILAKFLSPAGKKEQAPLSFVLDVTRDDQVWNHAIFRYDSKIGEKTPLKVGNLKDPYSYWRAKGTTHIVDVYTRMVYAVENGPFIAPTVEDDSLNYKIYHYTLDLNEKEEIIGGEWHGYVLQGNLPNSYIPMHRDKYAAFDEGITPLSGEALLKNLHHLIGEKLSPLEWKSRVDAPDFIWSYPQGTELSTGKLDPAFLKKLHNCSINDNLPTEEIKLKQKRGWSSHKTYLLNYVDCD